MLAFLSIAALVVVAVFMQFDTGRAFAMSGGFLGMAILQIVKLLRTRDVGFGVRQ